MTRRSGSFITETPSLTSVNSGSGIWPITEASQNIGNARWPYYFPTTSYTINNSLRFRSSASAYLNRTPASAGNRQTWTWSAWVKRGTLGVTNYIFCARTALGTSSGTIFTGLNFTSSDTLNFRNYIYGTGEDVTVTTSQVFRDPSAWYHIALALDTTQGSSSNRVKMYVNGVQVTAFSAATYPSQNEQLAINYPFAHQLARQTDSAGTGSDFYDGYWSEINFIDGQALTPSSFGAFDATSGVWQPVKYSGTYGTNGFYLKFSDTTSTTTLCYDYSGNGNNWTPNNISLTAGSTYDSMLDSPTNYDNGGNGVGNYAVLNPLNNPGGSLIADGNLGVTTASTGNGRVVGSIAVPSGKWYWEITPTNLATNAFIGIALASESTSAYPGSTATSYGYVDANGYKYNNGSGSAYGATYTVNDVIGVALDLDAGTLVFYKNGSSQGTAFSGLSGSYVPAISDGGTGTSVFVFNFGQRPFAYTPPTGYKALNTQNLPAASIVNGASFMAATLYTGNGSSQTIVNSGGFQPDLVWVKERSSTAWNVLCDSVRGANKGLYSNDTYQEDALTNTFQSFDSNGFTVAYNSAYTSVFTNRSTQTYVGWQWKAGGTAVTNTAGSISSQVSANTTAGFSVVTYTGTGSAATVGHGLGVAPSMVIVKPRVATTTSDGWCTGHTSIGWGNFLELNSTNASTAASNRWNNTAPTSSLLTLGSVITDSGKTYVAYCFAAIAGYSAFGSYTGNGSTDGPFVYLGFRPRFIMVKCSSTSSGSTDWWMFDTSRLGYNVHNANLSANTSAIEYDDLRLDILSNGFKLRVSYTNINASGETFIYAAFAENPFKYSLAR